MYVSDYILVWRQEAGSRFHLREQMSGRRVGPYLVRPCVEAPTIASLVGIAVICGLVAPLLASVLFVLIATGAITVAVAALSIVYGTGFWVACLAWLAGAAGLQIGYVVSLGALAWRRRAIGVPLESSPGARQPARDPSWQTGKTEVEPARTINNSSTGATS